MPVFGAGRAPSPAFNAAGPHSCSPGFPRSSRPNVPGWSWSAAHGVSHTANRLLKSCALLQKLLSLWLFQRKYFSVSLWGNLAEGLAGAGGSLQTVSVRRGVSEYVCLKGWRYLFYIALYFKAEKTAQKCLEREAKQESWGVKKN